ncbi:MAG TPA: hypothetical protein VD908_03260 [Cytophagales bacterium]|nr:hypothetical protein [Cytophagales bacterium]
MEFHLLFSLKTIFPLLFILFLSIEIKAQTLNGESEQPVSEQYVRPSKNNDSISSDSTQKAIKKLNKQKKKAERQAKKLNKLKTKPGEEISKSSAIVDQKSDQLIESVLAEDTTQHRSKARKKLNKNKEKLGKTAKKEKSKQLKKAEDKVVNTLKNTEEV